MLLTFVILYAAAMILTLATALAAIRRAPLGWQDRAGFHYGRPIVLRPACLTVNYSPYPPRRTRIFRGKILWKPSRARMALIVRQARRINPDFPLSTVNSPVTQ
ncbi:MAG: hypothetical protein ABSH20_29460 [Tepidisphaeraceae bacterium]|jgi:hypothetical protein